MLHNDDHTYMICVVRTIDVVDCTLGTSAGSFEDLGIACGEIEVLGRINAGIAFVTRDWIDG
jgi:hypothetical protein